MSPARRLADRNPFEIYLLTVTFTASVPAAAGVVLPGSIAEQLPGWPARVWAICLFVGCSCALVGLGWKRPSFTRVSVTGLLLEQVGLVMAGTTTALYGAAIILSVPERGLLAAALALAFGFACLAQAFKIQRFIKAAKPV